MKKLIAFALGLCVAVAASAQVKQYVYELAEFDALSVANEFDVTVAYGEQYSLVLTVDEPLKEYVNFNVKNGLLAISLDEKSIPSDVKKMYKGKNTPDPTYRIEIFTPGEIGNLSFKDKAILTAVRDVPAKEKLTFTATDNALIRTFQAEAKEVELNIDKKVSAIVTLNAAKVKANVAGSSNVELTCASKSADVTVAGSSKLVFHGELETLDFNIKGSANSVINGSCDSAVFTCAGSSEVNALNITADDANVSMSGLCTLTEAASKKLKVELSGGSTLIFNNNPEIDVVNIKSSSLLRYGTNAAKSK